MTIAMSVIVSSEIRSQDITDVWLRDVTKRINIHIFADKENTTVGREIL